MIKKIIISSLVLNLALLLGRLSGFARELIVARFFGLNPEADVVILWFTLPDLLLNILAGAAVGAALIPVFVQNEAEAKSVWFQALIASLLGGLIIAVGLQFFSTTLIFLLAPGLSPALISLADYGVKVSIFIFPLSLLVAVNAAYFHYKGRFFIAGIGTLVFNAVLIVGLVLCQVFLVGNLKYVLLSLFAAAAIRFLYQFVLIFDIRTIKWLGRCNYLTLDMAKRFLQSMMSSGVIFLFPVVGRSFSSAGGEGGVAKFNYMFKLLELPLMLAVTFLSIVFLPSLAKSWASDKQEYLRLAVRGGEVSLVIAIFVMLPVWAFSDVYSNAVYYGALGGSELSLFAECIKYGAFLIITQGLILFLTSAFNASGRTGVPLVANLVAILLFALILGAFKVTSMFSIIVCLVVSQVIGLSIMISMFIVMWRRELHEVVSYRWLFTMLVAPSILMLLDSNLQSSSLGVRLSVTVPIYLGLAAYVAFSHPVFRGYLNKIIRKVWRDNSRV